MTFLSELRHDEAWTPTTTTPWLSWEIGAVREKSHPSPLGKTSHDQRDRCRGYCPPAMAVLTWDLRLQYCGKRLPWPVDTEGIRYRDEIVSGNAIGPTVCGLSGAPIVGTLDEGESAY
jgi:hypothetical protein